MKPLRIATRRSELALWQARHVASRIESELGRAAELLPLVTSGDRLKGSLAEQGGKGLFVKEIEAALLDGSADLAVHSAKDLPALSPEPLCFAAFPVRADARDALVVPAAPRDARVAPAGSLDALPAGARVGTGSLRRQAQLARLRPELRLLPLRGNVGTRLRRLDAGELDAVVLACAGLDRLGLANRIAERLDPERLLPAVGQGALAIEARRDDPLVAALAALDDAATATCVGAERACLARLGADCTVPLGAHAVLADGRLRLRARLFSPDGAVALEAERAGGAGEAEALGRAAAEDLLAQGGDALLERLRTGT